VVLRPGQRHDRLHRHPREPQPRFHHRRRRAPHVVEFIDNFEGWQLLEFPFSSFSRKEIGNGAPNDGFDRFEVHGWALGTLGTGGPRTFYVDEVSVYGDAGVSAPLTVNLTRQNTFVDEGRDGPGGGATEPSRWDPTTRTP
jgi:hypothetical protein